MRGFYDGLGLLLTPDAEARMRHYLDERPQGRHGEHTYSFDELGLDRQKVAARFDRYVRTFGVT